MNTANVRAQWLVIARVAWVALALLTLILYFGILPAAYQFAIRFYPQDALQALHIQASFLAAYTLTIETVGVLAFVSVGCFIFWRKSTNWLALLFSLAFITYPSSTDTVYLVTGTHSGLDRLAILLSSILLGLVPIVLYLFPDGRLVPRWTRGLLLGVVAWTLITFFLRLAGFAPLKTGLAFDAWIILGFFVWLGSGIVALAYRYLRLATPAQRQQIKWLVFGLAGTFLVSLAYTVPLATLSGLRQGSLVLAFVIVGFPLAIASRLLIPLAVTFSILRYHLWHIDVIIRRTLVYTLLSGLLAPAYFGSVVALQALFRTLTGQTSQIAIVLSTLAIAALFFPLRQRVQAFIDRRFYRRKYDAAQTLAAFGATLRDHVDLDVLSERLVAVVDETMQPAAVSLWLKDGAIPTIAGLSTGSGAEQRL